MALPNLDPSRAVSKLTQSLTKTFDPNKLADAISRKSKKVADMKSAKAVGGTDSIVGELQKQTSVLEKMLQLQRDAMTQAAKDRVRKLEAEREGARKQAGVAEQTKGVKAGTGATTLAAIATIVSGFFSGILDSVKAIFKLTRLDKVFIGIKNLFTPNGAIGKLFLNMKSRFVMFADDAIKIIDDLIQPVKDVFKNFKTKALVFADDAIKIIDDLIQPIKNLFTGEGKIASLFKSIMKPFMFPFEGFIDDVAKPFKAITSSDEGGLLKRLFGSIVKPFQSAITFVDELIQPIKNFFTAEGPIGKVFGSIKGAFSIFSEGGQLMSMLNGIGKVLGKLFFPLTLIMTAYDTVKGMIEGFEDGGFLGGIEGAITGLLNSIVGAPLNLLKSGVSWILGKFGFKEAEKMLDSFSFEDLISKAIGGIIDAIKYVINGLIEGAAKVVSIFSDSGAEKIRSFKFDVEGDRKKAEEAALKRAEENKKAETQQATVVPKGAIPVQPATREAGGIQNGVGSVLKDYEAGKAKQGMQPGIGSVYREQSKIIQDQKVRELEQRQAERAVQQAQAAARQRASATNNNIVTNAPQVITNTTIQSRPSATASGNRIPNSNGFFGIQNGIGAAY